MSPGVYSALIHAVKEIKLLDITFAAGVEKLDKDEREVNVMTFEILCHLLAYVGFFLGGGGGWDP